MPSATAYKRLSERPVGYILAAAFGLLGGPIGIFTSPGILFILNKTMKAKDENRPNRFLAWALIGIIGAPLSLAPVINNTEPLSNNTKPSASDWRSKVTPGEHTSSGIGSPSATSTYNQSTETTQSTSEPATQDSSTKNNASKYSKDDTINQYIVFLRMLKADGAPSEGMGGLETRSRATDMLKAAGFDSSLMENIDRKNAWDEVFGTR